MSMTTAKPDSAPLMLSVSGARGIVGSTMTPATAADFAAALGSWLKEATGERAPLVVVGRDSRPSGEMLAGAATAGLISVGCRVIELGIVTTPTVGVMIEERRAHGGMVLTASHNPIQWNGLKCLNADGVAPPKDDAKRIIERFQARAIDFASATDLHPLEADDTATNAHVKLVLQHVDVSAIRAANFRVVLDSINGAGCIGGRALLEALGCDVVHINGEPTGRFAHTPEPVEENLRDLAQTVAHENAAIGFAQDPDADRLAIIDEGGRYIGEEYTLVLCARSVLARRGDGDGAFIIAANLSTSRMIDDLAARFRSVEVVRTAVGEANVVEALKTRARDRGACFGGEGNGGVIFPEVCWVRDSLSSMALVLDLLARDKRSLSTIVDDLPRYVMVKRKYDLSAVGGREAVPAVLDRVRAAFADERIDEADGVRIDLDDGWVHVRPSNTEPIVRLIAEAKTKERVEALVADAARAAGLG